MHIRIDSSVVKYVAASSLLVVIGTSVTDRLRADEVPSSANAQKSSDTLELKVGKKGIEDFAYIASATVWVWPPLDPRIIFVCWENPSKHYESKMSAVEHAISVSWQASSGVIFRGWQNTCSSKTTGIHILIDDQGPHTQGLGRQLDGVHDGMVLNFDFNKWGEPCKATAMYDKCVASIAVHEFGHALGFAHEQNRPDTPGECAEKPQGGNGDVMLTPWDIHSVMNYCNPIYNNDGQLSPFDVAAVQRLYGKRGE